MCSAVFRVIRFRKGGPLSGPLLPAETLSLAPPSAQPCGLCLPPWRGFVLGKPPAGGKKDVRYRFAQRSGKGVSVAVWRAGIGYRFRARTRPPPRRAAAGTAINVKVLQNRELFSYLADKDDCVL